MRNAPDRRVPTRDTRVDQRPAARPAGAGPGTARPSTRPATGPPTTTTGVRPSSPARDVPRQPRLRRAGRTTSMPTGTGTSTSATRTIGGRWRRRAGADPRAVPARGRWLRGPRRPATSNANTRHGSGAARRRRAPARPPRPRGRPLRPPRNDRAARRNGGRRNPGGRSSPPARERTFPFMIPRVSPGTWRAGTGPRESAEARQCEEAPHRWPSPRERTGAPSGCPTPW